MPEYDDTNKGILFNEEAKKSERSPDWTGKLDVEGKEYRIAAWERTTKTGTPILSLAISEPKVVTDAGYQKAKAVAEKLKPKQDEVIEDIGDEPVNLDDIPF
jgi:uncharacterized protein (DUF736 family)